jgi:hypothetical protein
MAINRYDYPTSKFLVNAEADVRGKKSMQLSFTEILTAVDKAESRNEKVEILRQHYKPPMINLFQSVFDPNVKWLLPKGPIKYTPTDYNDVEGRLFQESKKLYLFVEGGNSSLTDERRLHLFMQVLESITPADAELLIEFKDKNMPFESVTPDLVNEALGTQFSTNTGDQIEQDVQEKN